MTKKEILQMIRDGRTSPQEGMALLRGLPKVKPSQNQDKAHIRPPDVAVIGMACRFPGARSLDAFWTMLCEGRDAVGPIPAERWDADEWFDPDPREPDKTYSKWAGCLDDFEHFDPAFFKISPAEAELMDPQQRQFLMTAWQAVEHAAYPNHKLERSRCGVFVGAGAGDYHVKLAEHGLVGGAHAFMGNADAILSARIAYFLNLRGPSLAVDTACSSSMVAIHLARESLCRKETDIALAGGVTILTTPRFHIMASKAGMLSPRGRCRAFDEGADGFVPGEGIAVIMLKPLADAMADRDPIHAVIAGSAINQDGRTNGITAPSAPSQTALEVEVYNRFGIDPNHIGYVETHGTGTRLGDPIELEALQAGFRQFTNRSGFCHIGSVKTNIGHALSAAGIAGVIKTVLCLSRRTLAPSLHFERLNSHINLTDSPFLISQTRQDWPAPAGGVRHAAVSSFGFSGTNAHMVLREAPPSPGDQPDVRPYTLIALSAASDTALNNRIQDLAAFLTHHPTNLENVSHTLLCGRSHLGKRRAWVVRDLQDWLQQITRPVDLTHSEADESQALLEQLRPPACSSQGHEWIRQALSTLGARFERGDTLNWETMFTRARRIPLPVYRFDEAAYKIPPATQKTAQLHPLLHTNRSTLTTQKFETELDGNAFYLRDHLVAGRKVLPGVAFLEAARAAGQYALPKPPTQLRNVTWRRLLMVEDKRDMAVELYPDQDGVTFKILADPNDTARLVADGQLLSRAVQPETLPLDSIRAQLTTHLSHAECYALVDAGQMKYGKTFRVIQALQCGPNQVLAQLAPPHVAQAERAHWHIHPAMADGLLQTMLGLVDVNRDQPRLLPSSVEEVSFPGHALEGRWAYVTLRRGDPNTDETVTIDAKLADDEGRVVLAMKNVLLRRPQSPHTKAPAPTLSGDADHPLHAQLTREVSDIVAKILKVSVTQIDLEDDLADYGFDSISFTELGDRLNDFLSLDLPPSIFFEHKHLASFINYLLQEHRPAVTARLGGDSSDPAPEPQQPQQQPVTGGRFLSDSHEPAAVIGMAATMPGSRNLNHFWDQLAANQHMISEIPADRWDWRAFHGNPVDDINKCNVRHGAFMAHVDGFDPLFFGISPREAEAMDPQQRLFLQTVWHTFEDAGYPPSQIAGGKIGVFVGVANMDYNELWRAQTGEINAHAATGTAHSIVPNRVSFLLDLHGPSEPIDTACSSSLVAICRAMTALREGSCDMAIAGGVNVIITPTLHIAFNKAGMLNPEGRCRTFDKKAAGYVRGEGVGAVLLKPLSLAQRDGDFIHAVIPGGAVNHGGHASSLTAPNPSAQAELLTEAWRRARISPDQLSYVEAHGTGTPLGDPAEVRGLVKAYGRFTAQTGAQPRPDSCALGSVKTNIGHLETAAGIAGVIKIVLAMKHHQLPGNCGFEEINPYIDLNNSPFHILKNTRDWYPTDAQGKPIPRIAGVSSFGFGGANAHIVIREYETTKTQPTEAGPQLVVLSAKDPERLKQSAADLLEAVQQPELRIQDVAHALRVGRESFAARLALVVDSIQHLRDTLELVVSGQSPPQVFASDATTPNTAGSGKARQIPADLMQAGQLAQIASEWVSGAGADWSALPIVDAFRIPLPGYPFAVESYMPPQTRRADKPKALHPLVGHNTSTLTVQNYTTHLDADEFFLADHIIAGHAVLPGAAYIEWARAAGELAAEQPVTSIRNLTWSRPLIGGASAPKAQIQLTPTPDHQALFRIVSFAGSKELLHAEGALGFGELGPPDLSQKPLPEGLTKVWDTDDTYRFLADLGVNLGNGFRAVREVRFGAGAAVSQLKVPHESHPYGLHPGLIDGIFQTGAVLFSELKSDGMFLPYSVEEILIYDQVPAHGRASARIIGSPTAEGARLQLSFFDDSDRLILQFRGFKVRAVTGARNSRNQTQAAPDAAQTVVAKRIWRPVQTTPMADQPLLVFDAAGDLFQSLNAGDDRRIQPATDFGANESGFYLNPDNAEHWTQLRKHNPASPLIVSRYHHKDAVAEVTWITAMIQGLGAATGKQSGHIIYLYQADANHSHSSAQAMEAFARTVVMEYPGLHFRVIGLSASDNNPRQTILETPAEKSAHLRWESTPQASGWEVITTGTPIDNPQLKGQTILITGGAGGLGRLLAADLAQKGCSLVLTGRRDADPALLDGLGPNAIYVRADLGSRHEVEALIQKADDRFGAIHGIIHAAGLTRDALIAKKTPDQIRQVLTPKLAGTQYLDELTRHEPLSWFTLFGSLAGLTGNPGQADYAFANNYLARFAEEREGLRAAGLRAGKTICLEWPFWADGGMQLPQRTLAMIEKQTGMAPLPNAVGLDLFYRALTSEGTGWAVAYGHRDKIHNTLLPNSAEKKTIPNHRLSKAATAKAENGILDLVSAVLKLDRTRLNQDDPIDTLGFDSINLADLSNRLTTTFDIEVDPSELFGHQTLRSFLNYLMEHHQDKLAKHFAVAGERVETPQPTPAESPIPPQITRPKWGARLTQAPSTPSHEPIAIIGMSGAMPHSPDLDTFWNHLDQGHDLVTEIPAARWDWRDWYGDPAQGKTRVKCGAFMPDIDCFDASFFGISPKEATLMDPQHRLFLQSVWHAIEDAGHRPEDLSGQRIPLFVGVSSFDYQEVLRQATSGVQPHELTGNAHSILANRTSFYFNLRGASEPVDTACSSSLVAVHRAIQALRSGKSPAAIAGGVNLLLSPLVQFAFARSGMLNPAGRCMTFDKDAAGYVRGEGVGALLLKPLSTALADGNPIHALIRGSAVNHGGRANTLVAPNPNAQAEVIAEAVRDAQVDPATITYIEAHGTGTALGDPIEINGLKKAFGDLFAERGVKPPQEPFCALGTVKANLGHLEAAAGVAGLFKLILCFRHGRLPGNIHLAEQNPYIRLEHSPFYLLREGRVWQPQTDSSGGLLPRRAGISSFGFGGANSHLVLEEYRPDFHGQSLSTAHRMETLVFVFSAKNHQRLQACAQQYLDFIETCDPLPDAGAAAYTLQAGRQAMTHRLALAVTGWDQLKAGLQAFLAGKPTADTYQGDGSPSDISALMDDEDGDEFLAFLMKAGKLRKLARLWAAGVNPDWSALYAQGTPPRLHLPGYPFAKERFWAGSKPLGDGAAPLPTKAAPLQKNMPEPKSQPSTAAVQKSPPSNQAQTADKQSKQSPNAVEIGNFLKERLTALAGFENTDVNADLAEMGLDSIFAMELLSDIEARFGLRLYPNELMEHNTLTKLIDHIRLELSDTLEPQPKQASTLIEQPTTHPTPQEISQVQQSDKPVIFLLSTPRAGSTLFRVMLMGHSRCFSPPELHLLPFTDMGVRARVLHDQGKQFLAEGLIQAVADLNRGDVAQAKALINTWEQENAPMARVYDYLAEARENQILIDKSPSYAESPAILERGQATCPNARYIHLVRHPLSMAASFVKNRFHKLLGVDGDPWTHALQLWSRYNTNLEQFLGQLPPDRVVRIRFEDLVRDSQGVMRALCARLDLAYEPALLNPYGGERLAAGLHPQSLPIGDPNFHNHKRIDPEMADIWTNHPDKFALMSPQMRQQARAYGYNSAVPAFDLGPSQAQFMRRHAAHSGFHLVHRFSMTKADFELQNAWRWVMQSNGALSHQFQIDPGTQRPLMEPVILFQTKDLRRVAKAKRAAALSKFEQTLHQQLNPFEGRTAAMGVVQLAGKQSRIIWVIHHLVADGVSLALLIRQFQQALDQPLQQFPNRDDRLQEYTAGMREQLEKSAQQAAGVWRQMVSQAQDLPCDGDGQNRADCEQTLMRQAPLDSFGGPDLSPAERHAQIAAGLLAALSQWSQSPSLLVALRQHGRNDSSSTAYHDLVGWFATDIPLRLDCDGSRSQIAARFTAALDQLPQHKSTYAWAANEGDLPDLCDRTPVRFNYQPAGFHGLNRDAETTVYQEPHQDRGYLLDCISRVGETAVCLMIRYAGGIHEPETIARIMDAWMGAIGSAETDPG